MQGVVMHSPGDLRIEQVAVPQMGPRQIRVRVSAGGICGSDLHYYNHGGFGTVRVKEPMVLGHEASGVVEAVGSAVEGLSVGMRIAINPSRPCGHCGYCREGLQTHCLNMYYHGSAMRFPHAQGLFRQSLVVDAAQAYPIPDTVSLEQAAMAEPLAVALHAVRIAGALVGRRVLVTGSGPIGALVVAAARLGGAMEVVATDIADFPLGIAERLGASRIINIVKTPDGLDGYSADKGSFDVAFEASGNEKALAGALAAVRPRGRVVQLGLGGDMAVPMGLVVSKELQLLGTFRFDVEFGQAIAYLANGQIDISPLTTASMPFQRATEAFELANDRSRAMKIQLTFG